MAHIDLGVDERAYPGIDGLLAFRPETAKPLGALANALLRAFNRYVDGLGTWAPEDQGLYDIAARHVTAHGYGG